MCSNTKTLEIKFPSKGKKPCTSSNNGRSNVLVVKDRQGKTERQARKDRKAGKERCTGRQGELQMQARRATNAGKERHKGRQEKLQKKNRNGTKVGKERFKGRRKNTKCQILLMIVLLYSTFSITVPYISIIL